MGSLYHLIDAAALDAVRPSGTIEPGTEGFVHLSAGSQVAATVGRHFAGRTEDLLVLELDDSRLSAVVWEEGEPGELFPHLHAPLPLDTVVSVRRWSEDIGAHLAADHS